MKEWKEVELNEVALLSRDSVKPEHIKTNELYLGLESLEATGACNPIKTTLGALKSNKYTFSENHILYGKLRPYLRKIVQPEFKGICSTDIIPILPLKDKIDTRYLYHYLRSDNMVQFATSRCSGANLPRISPKQINKFKIPLPPLPIQKKIAAILDAADDYRKKTKALLDKYDELTQSIFLDMFGDPVRNEKGLKKGTIRDIVTEVKYGTSSKAIENGSYPYLRMNNIDYKGYMNYEKLKYIDVSEKDKTKYIVKKGDVLFNRTNSKELVGKTGIITHNKEMIIAGYLIRIRLKDEHNPYFLWSHLNSRWGKLTLMNMCKNIVGMANINAQELQNIPILLPPTNLQNAFATKIESIALNKIELTKQIDKSEQLFQSLLQRAFMGELVK